MKNLNFIGDYTIYTYDDKRIAFHTDDYHISGTSHDDPDPFFYGVGYDDNGYEYTLVWYFKKEHLVIDDDGYVTWVVGDDELVDWHDFPDDILNSGLAVERAKACWDKIDDLICKGYKMI